MLDLGKVWVGNRETSERDSAEHPAQERGLAVVSRAPCKFDKELNDIGLGPSGFHPWRKLTMMDKEKLWTPQNTETFLKC